MRTIQKYITLLSCVPLILIITFLTRNNTYNVIHEGQVKLRYLMSNNPASSKVQHNFTSCIVDDWIKFDNSSRTLKRYLFCDDVAEKSDILCRWYLDQQNVTNHSECLLPQDGYKVPNVVFYVTFGKYDFKMENYLCVLSARVQKTKNVYMVGDYYPKGKWWTKLVEDMPELKFIKRTQPRQISGNIVKWPAHASDFVRLQVLLGNGGIYMDTDEMFIKSFNPLRNFPITMGLVDENTGMGNAVIVTERHSRFLQKLFDNYKSFNGSNYYANSLQAALKLWKANKTELHLESENFYRPGWFEDDKLFKTAGYNWRQKYAIHVWSVKNSHRMPKRLDEFKNANTTLAELFRNVYYGDSRPRYLVENKTT